MAHVVEPSLAEKLKLASPDPTVPDGPPLIETVGAVVSATTTLKVFVVVLLP